MTVKFELKAVEKRITVAEFNNGYSHIAVDDHCWVIINGGKQSSHIFIEAMDVLKKLPSCPHDYAPYQELYENLAKYGWEFAWKYLKDSNKDLLDLMN